MIKINRKTFCGTLEYMAPELVRHEYYNDNADMWSLGILLYEMLHGFPPFRGKVFRDTISKILGNRLRFAHSIKEDARDVMEVILNLDSNERPTVCQILDSPWGRRMAAELNSPELLYDNNEQSNENDGCFISVAKAIEHKGGVFDELGNNTPKIRTIEMEKLRRGSTGIDVAYKL